MLVYVPCNLQSQHLRERRGMVAGSRTVGTSVYVELKGRQLKERVVLLGLMYSFLRAHTPHLPPQFTLLIGSSLHD